MGKPDRGAEGPGRPQAKAEPHAAGTGRRDDRLKDMQVRLQDTFRHSPVVLEQQAQRARDVQPRIADWITGFAGSMNFVYIHIVLFTVWTLFIEPKPWPANRLLSKSAGPGS